MLSLWFSLLITVAIALVSCGSGSRAGGEDSSVSSKRSDSIAIPAARGMRLRNGFGSADALVKEALDAFAALDTARLERLMIDRTEFDRHLYPELGSRYPAARDTNELARGFVWENHWLSARKGMKKALRELGGKRMTLLSVRFTGEIERFPTYTIHPGTEVKVKLDGSEADLLALGSIVEMDGVYKLLSYRDRD